MTGILQDTFPPLNPGLTAPAILLMRPHPNHCRVPISALQMPRASVQTSYMQCRIERDPLNRLHPSHQSIPLQRLPEMPS